MNEIQSDLYNSIKQGVENELLDIIFFEKLFWDYSFMHNY